MRTTVVIDPNVRHKGHGTYSGFEDVMDGDIPQVGQLVDAVETEANLVTIAEVTEVDWEKRLIYLNLSWESLHPR